MNNLLFTTLIIILLYYFFYYLPQQKKLNTANPPLKHHQYTQTEPDPTITNLTKQKNLVSEELNLAISKTKELQKQAITYENRIKTKDLQITKLQTQVRELAKKPTSSKSTQTDNKDLENTLDTLIKDIQALNNEL